MKNPAQRTQLAALIKEQILSEATSWEIQELVGNLPEASDEACGYFCDRYELGNWFYEAMILNDIDISELLIDLGNQRQAEEKEAADDRAEIERDLRLSQGYPY